VVDGTVSLRAVPGLPIVRPGDDLAALIKAALAVAEIDVQNGDVFVVTSKVVSRAEGRFARLSEVTPSPRARQLAEAVDKDPALVQLILDESTSVSRTAPGVVIARHRCGIVSALLLPADPDASAATLRAKLVAQLGCHVGIVISDSLGRPFRFGTVGHAIGAAGIVALDDRRGTTDLYGRTLEHTEVALADQLAAAADMVAGQAGEGRPVVLIRGVDRQGNGRAADLLRPPEKDLYA
jgi:coenzyme F420-0:L-glutamate ligase/coenzyme F420-1:gamma-L-glutamate ligase